MKIKLAVLEKDESYLNRIVSVFSTKYADKFEMYFFTELKAALPMLDSAKIDVFLAGDAFEIEVSELPSRCGFAYFVDSSDIGMVKGQKAVCKFQKAELIYKQILSIYAEKAGNAVGLRSEDKDRTGVILFDSISGGAGASSMAAACALHYAARNQKVLYLNLERYGSSDVFFSGEGQFDFSDVIYALKSRKTNLPLKLESCVKQDPRGVFFYSQPKLALDLLELHSDEAVCLLSELKASGIYDHIIVDADFRMDREFLSVYREAYAVLWVSDGSEVSNTKIYRAYQAISALEQNVDMPLLDRVLLIYNKFSNKTGRTMENVDLKSIGGAPRYEHANTGQVLAQLAMTDIFDKIN